MPKDISKCIYYTEIKVYETSFHLALNLILCIEELTKFEVINFDLVMFSVQKFCFSCKYLSFLSCEFF